MTLGRQVLLPHPSVAFPHECACLGLGPLGMGPLQILDLSLCLPLLPALLSPELWLLRLLDSHLCSSTQAVHWPPPGCLFLLSDGGTPSAWRAGAIMGFPHLVPTFQGIPVLCRPSSVSCKLLFRALDN